MLLKLHYAKFDVSRLFCSKVMEEKPFLVKEELNSWQRVVLIKIFQGIKIFQFDTFKFI